jgi:myo-inositol-1(or 4)-monophosphatase
VQRGQAPNGALRVRHCPALDKAILMTTSPLLMKEADRALFGQVENAVRLLRCGGVCYPYCMLAAGHVNL